MSKSYMTADELGGLVKKLADGNIAEFSRLMRIGRRTTYRYLESGLCGEGLSGPFADFLRMLATGKITMAEVETARAKHEKGRSNGKSKK